jgi:PqqD family protein of HPr-rel-A system
VLLRLNPAVNLHWRQWEAEWVVFDAASGGTHQMDELTAFVLSCVEEAALTEAALLAEVAEATALASGKIDAALKPVLEQLTRLGLIETVQE